MNKLFQYIRKAFGQKQQPKEKTQLELLQEEYIHKAKEEQDLHKCIEQWTEIDRDLNLKLSVADQTLEPEIVKGEIQRKIKETDDRYIVEVKERKELIKVIGQSISNLEQDLLAKAISITAVVDEHTQEEIRGKVTQYRKNAEIQLETGEILGDEWFPSPLAPIWKAIQDVMEGEKDDVEKGGEGSRGGKVIGHTRSGKAIYGDFGKHNKYPGSKEYSKLASDYTYEDHQDAHKLHHKIAEDALNHRDYEDSEDNVHAWISTHHGAASQYHYSELRKRDLGKAEDVEEFEKAYANAIVRDREGRILFLKRGNDKILEPGKYCLPGGHIEKGESVETAVLRELKEEANLKGAAPIIIGTVKCKDGELAHYAECDVIDGQLALLDGENINGEWMDREQWEKADLMLDLKDHLEEVMTKAEDPELEKGGEGSRGGKIIGHTKSGKPIYDSASHPGHKKEHPIHKKVDKFLEQFPDDAKKWSQATDEVKDLAHSARRIINELDLDIRHDDTGGHPSLDFMKIKTPSEWNTKGKAYIREALSKMSDSAKDVYMKRHSDLIEKAIDEDNPFYLDPEELEKGGEGSRGGKVIGHTKSGHPIYDHKNKTHYNSFRNKPVWAFGNNPSKDVVEFYSNKLEEKKISHSIHYNLDDSYGKFSNKVHVIEFKNKEDWEKENKDDDDIGKAEEDELNIDYNSPDYQDELMKAMLMVEEAIHEDILSTGDIEILKARRPASEGEERTWGGKKYKKVGGKWRPVGKTSGEEPQKKMDVKNLTAHAENTSSDQLKKVADDPKHPHSDAAKRELERRAGEDAKDKERKGKEQQQKSKYEYHKEMRDYHRQQGDQHFKAHQDLNKKIEKVAQDESKSHIEQAYRQQSQELYKKSQEHYAESDKHHGQMEKFKPAQED